jgi:hypothetical protein
VPRRTLGLLLCAALLSSLGTPVVLVQGFAWARMAVRFARRDGVKRSLDETFDGRHPCALCRMVGRAARPGPTLAARPEPRPEAALPARPVLVARVEARPVEAPAASARPSRASPPDAPPPKPSLS